MLLWDMYAAKWYREQSTLVYHIDTCIHSFLMLYRLLVSRTFFPAFRRNLIFSISRVVLISVDDFLRKTSSVTWRHGDGDYSKRITFKRHQKTKVTMDQKNQNRKKLEFHQNSHTIHDLQQTGFSYIYLVQTWLVFDTCVVLYNEKPKQTISDEIKNKVDGTRHQLFSLSLFYFYIIIFEKWRWMHGVKPNSGSCLNHTPRIRTRSKTSQAKIFLGLVQHVFFFLLFSCSFLVCRLLLIWSLLIFSFFFVYVIFICVVILTLSPFDSLLYLDKFLFFLLYCFLVFNFRLLNFSFRFWCKMRWTVKRSEKIIIKDLNQLATGSRCFIYNFLFVCCEEIGLGCIIFSSFLVWNFVIRFTTVFFLFFFLHRCWFDMTGFYIFL